MFLRALVLSLNTASFVFGSNGYMLYCNVTGMAQTSTSHKLNYMSDKLLNRWKRMLKSRVHNAWLNMIMIVCLSLVVVYLRKAISHMWRMQWYLRCCLMWEGWLGDKGQFRGNIDFSIYCSWFVWKIYSFFCSTNRHSIWTYLPRRLLYSEFVGPTTGCDKKLTSICMIWKENFEQ